MPPIETVSGPVDDADLGLVLAHEHLSTTSEAVRTQWPHLYDEAREYDLAVEQVRAAMDRGVKTIVDPSCMDLNRNVRLAQRVVEETGIQLVMATGIYGAKYTFLPPYFENREPSAMVDAFVHDIEEGIQGSGVKAAFLKCAVDEPGVTEHVERILRAIAQASLRTGRPIMAHSHPATRRGLEIMDVFEDEGVDPRRVQIAHTGDTDELDYIEELLGRGCWIGMDRYGLDVILPTDRRNATVIELCRRGYADRMMLSQDACATIDWYPEDLVKQMAPNWHFTFLWEGVLPALADGGVTDEQIDTMMRDNPRGWLTA
ncbi:MAG: phosphotriesterase [Actinomycetota bacterium]|nr:phosphotriesterase [Actinomycetota bacterium]